VRIFANAEVQLEILVAVVLSLILGGLIGLEREEKEKPAGLRTHMLVAGASALFTSLGQVIIEQFSSEIYGQMVRSDPVRVIEAVVTGISFLGAGTIFRQRRGEGVKGLTTAASILFTAGLGIAVSLHQYIVAVGATAIALVVLRLIRRFEDMLVGQDEDNG
jgi:putative Mg2+ transporter-C (MgtC) family protein